MTVVTQRSPPYRGTGQALRGNDGWWGGIGEGQPQGLPLRGGWPGMDSGPVSWYGVTFLRRNYG